MQERKLKTIIHFLSILVREMDGSYYNLPILVWDKILGFLSRRELFELTETLPKLLELHDVMSEVDRFKNEHPYVCPKCGSRTHVVSYTFTGLRIPCSFCPEPRHPFHEL